MKAAKGIGPKTAQRVVNELKDKAPAVMAMGAGTPAAALVNDPLADGSTIFDAFIPSAATATRLMAWTSWSPAPDELRWGMPLPRMRNILPLWVPGGIFSITLPSRVGTSSSPPSAAVGNPMGTSQ